MAGESAETKAKKVISIQRLYELFGQHKQIVLADFTNVGANQIQLIRKMLRSYKGELVISKNTLIKKVIKMRAEGITQDQFKYLEQKHGGKIPELQVLSKELKQKVALIFCDAAVYELKKKIEANKIPTQARIGAIAPIDFTCPGGPTGLDPSQINFFHALNISTKIVKGQIEITKDFKVCTAGKKVKASEAALLKKLNFKPFEYGMKLKVVYSNGAILPKQVLQIDPSSLLGRFQRGVQNIASISLGSGYLIEATVPLIIANSFRNIAALSIETGYKVKEVDSLASLSAPKAQKAEKKQEKPKQDKKEAKKETKKQAPPPPPVQDDEGGMGGLFD